VSWRSFFGAISPTVRVRPIVLALLVLAGAASPALVAGQQQPPPKPAQDEFVPIDQLPPGDQLPAARFLIIAYAVAWVLVAVYLFSIWQRLGRVEREIADVTRRIGQEGNRPRPSPGGPGGRA
jgi:CcmD family protein